MKEDKREQGIKEMIKIIEEDCKKTDCKGLSDCVSCNCEALINAGYRKQSEVAKEILDIIHTYWEEEDSDYLIEQAIIQKYEVDYV